MKKKFTTTLEENTIIKLSIFARLKNKKGVNELIEEMVEFYISDSELRGIFENESTINENK